MQSHWWFLRSANIHSSFQRSRTIRNCTVLQARARQDHYWRRQSLLSWSDGLHFLRMALTSVVRNSSSLQRHFTSPWQLLWPIASTVVVFFTSIISHRRMDWGRQNMNQGWAYYTAGHGVNDGQHVSRIQGQLREYRHCCLSYDILWRQNRWCWRSWRSYRSALILLRFSFETQTFQWRMQTAEDKSKGWRGGKAEKCRINGRHGLLSCHMRAAHVGRGGGWREKGTFVPVHALTQVQGKWVLALVTARREVWRLPLAGESEETNFRIGFRELILLIIIF